MLGHAIHDLMVICEQMIGARQELHVSMILSFALHLIEHFEVNFFVSCSAYVTGVLSCILLCRWFLQVEGHQEEHLICCMIHFLRFIVYFTVGVIPAMYSVDISLISVCRENLTKVLILFLCVAGRLACVRKRVQYSAKKITAAGPCIQTLYTCPQE